MAPTARRQPTLMFHLLVAIGVALLGTVALWFALSRHWTWYTWLGCWLVTINVVALAYYGYDKGRARSRSRRIPEAVLHTLTAIGGSVGAFTGMKLFRHKTVKGKFLVLFWCIVVLQVVLALWVAKLLWWEQLFGSAN